MERRDYRGSIIVAQVGRKVCITPGPFLQHDVLRGNKQSRRQTIDEADLYLEEMPLLRQDQSALNGITSPI